MSLKYPQCHSVPPLPPKPFTSPVPDMGTYRLVSSNESKKSRSGYRLYHRHLVSPSRL